MFNSGLQGYKVVAYNDDSFCSYTVTGSRRQRRKFPQCCPKETAAAEEGPKSLARQEGAPGASDIWREGARNWTKGREAFFFSNLTNFQIRGKESFVLSNVPALEARVKNVLPRWSGRRCRENLPRLGLQLPRPAGTTAFLSP
ncbi:hypothetical protein BaRGS_00017966 [Batillaria attramentaria]|uniref:Uncharacterized protein n=1 Tax=Batillaria attramentaria TaxID=370345 RepID=A0ABD0KVF3_9CAEN